MNELQRIHAVFIEAFDQDSLERLVKFHLNKNLNTITQGRDFATVVYELTKWAIQEGRIDELLNSAKEELPGNASVQRLTYTETSVLIPHNRSDEILMQSQDSISYAILLIRQLESEFKTFKKIIVGDDWASGVRSVSQDNQHQIKELIRRLDEFSRVVDARFSQFDSALEEVRREIGTIRNSVYRIENNQDDNILSTTQNKIVFGAIFLVLLSTAILVAVGSLGWM